MANAPRPRILAPHQSLVQGHAIFFATGAVSGTVLSFELGLLWPTFMRHAGAIIGMPFSWEGTAFFLEAIALGIFLYGWDRVHPWVHWASGVVIGIMGVLSGLFVVCANAWMNSPTGFRLGRWCRHRHRPLGGDVQFGRLGPGPAVDHALAPVWEANHMWLILAVVILLNGFPAAFSAIFTPTMFPSRSCCWASSCADAPSLLRTTTLPNRLRRATTITYS